MPPKLFLIDGQALIYRAYHALPYLSDSKGQPTNAIFGFTSMLLRFLTDRSVDYAVVAFDLPLPTFRHKEYAGYKAERPPMADDLSSQIPIIKEIVSAMGMYIAEFPGYEADDIIASLALQGEAKGWETYILSGDLDCAQIVRGKIKLLVPRVGLSDLQEIDEEAVKKRWGVPPEKIPDLKALAGDASDNIPGVPGIGPKRASQLLSQFGSVEEIYENLEKVPPDLREVLKNYKEMVLRNKHLVLLNKGLPFTLEDIPPFSPNWQEVRRILQRLEMKNLISRLPLQPEPSVALISEGVRKKEVKSPQEIAQLATSLSKEKEIAVSIGEGSLLLAPNPREVFVVPFSSAPSLFGEIGEEIAPLKPVLEGETSKIGHNLKQIYTYLKKEKGIEARNLSFDLMLASYLLNPLKGDHPIDEIYLEQIGADAPQEGYLRTALFFQLRDALRRRLEEEELLWVFENLEMPLIPVLGDMELTGIKIDKGYLRRVSLEMAERMRILEREIYEMAGMEFNIGSPKQLRFVLFEKMGLPAGKRKKTGLSTDAEVLESLAESYEIARKILQWRELAKCKGTYVDVLPKLADGEDRVHTTFNQAVTATGRLSSSDPNLQNIPIKGEWARKIREAFIPEKGYIFLSADYSQIELRILAHITEDPALMEAFDKGRDIHSLTASLIFGVELEDVTAELRRRAKVVNFGIIYGMSEFGLAKELGISEEEAKEHIRRYLERFPKVKEYRERIVEEAKEKGYVRTMFGRKRPLPEINSPNRMVREFGMRAAINAPIQGSAADLIKLAMINLHRRIKEENLPMKLLVQVHDELLVEAKEEKGEELAQVLKEEMEGAYTLKVPLIAEVSIGHSWGKS